MGVTAVPILALSLLFVWDCYLLPASTGPAFFCSHDEFAGFHVPSGHTTLVSTTSFINERARLAVVSVNANDLAPQNHHFASRISEAGTPRTDFFENCPR